MKLLIRLGIIAFAVYLCTLLVPGISVTGRWTSYVVIAVVFALVNALVKPVVKLLSLPLLLLTLGLFLVVVNAAMLGLTAALTDSLSVDGFSAAVVAALVISGVTWTAELLGITDKR